MIILPEKKPSIAAVDSIENNTLNRKEFNKNISNKLSLFSLVLFFCVRHRSVQCRLWIVEMKECADKNDVIFDIIFHWIRMG